ncbi:kynureninase [Comamonas testosteroni]|uniref:Kynureninase n=1 Tax=Comamonas testosteroni TaxID=285 RepID=A0A096FGI0_COMTE|nr:MULTISPECIES: kynureninase [Comamonas]KGH29044.1 kynureninase [Comamonas testosteroni]KOC30697.1 kynureninase [Comamonas testosteroni]KWT68407.1 Kynureninase [Comamonas testosteroni]MPT12568.1 kynureninase [Comamonas sp.]
MTTLQDCQALDAQDPLRALRERFALPQGVIYLDGNSLGAQPKAAAARVAEVVTQEWGQDLITSWNKAGWITLPERLGNQFAPWLGAGQGELVFTDTTSINLYKVLSAAARIAREDAPGRKKLISERSNFPTDLYIAQSVCQEYGLELVLLEPEEIAGALQTDVAISMLTHVNYRTGAMHDMAAVTAAAHAKGILCVWDLCHSAGAVPVDLKGADADFAVGCSYKYLNGGPGAPAFVWAHPRLINRFWQPLSGWFGHAEPFKFVPDYHPAQGIQRYLCGTQPMISMSVLQCGIDIYTEAEAFGGMAALRKKSLALTDLFIQLVQERCQGHGLGLATPREHAARGSQVCLTREEGLGVNGQGSGAYAIVQALIARGVIGDFRKGDGGTGRHKDILRFGFTPLYVGFADVWNAVEHLRQVLESGEWQRPEFNAVHAVT